MYSYFHHRLENVAWAVVTAVIVVFLHVLTLRAGFGFDACEYYIAAEDWLEGGRPYLDFFMTKTPGMMFLTAALFSMFGSHAEWLAWYTTAVNLGWAAASAWAVAPLIGRRLAWWVMPLCLVAGICCMINFWNTEQPLVLFMALGVGCWLRRLDHPVLLGLVAGLCIGIATVFKLFAVLALGSLGLMIFLLPGRSRRRDLLCLGVGFSAVIFLIVLWASSRGVLDAMWRESVMTALFDYQAHTSYLADFLKRIGWFVIPTASGMITNACRAIALRPVDRREPGFVLSILGLPFLIPLLKNQAAHYLVPFIPFAVAWVLWEGSRLWANLSQPIRGRLVAAVSVAGLVLVVALASYKRGSLERVWRGGDADKAREISARLARRVGSGERMIFINAGPYPHTALYWMTGERPYPWPFLAISGFVKQPIEDFGFEPFYEICADPKTRLLGIRFDVPMEETLPWVFSKSELARLERLLDQFYQPVAEFPGVYARKEPLEPPHAFGRGPYQGEPF